MIDWRNCHFKFTLLLKRPKPVCEIFTLAPKSVTNGFVKCQLRNKYAKKNYVQQDSYLLYINKNFIMEQSLTSWTDDLPLCAQSGIGISPNEVYKKNGRRTEMHPNEDRSFHFRYVCINLPQILMIMFKI